MKYIINDQFTKINETKGTIQNISSVFSVEVYNKAEADTGIILYPLNKFTFSGEDIYLRCAAGGWAEVRVIPFIVDAGGVISSGGISGIDSSMLATDEEIATLLDDIFGAGGASAIGDYQLATDEEIDALLDDIFG